MDEVRTYYNEKSKIYDEAFDSLVFRVLDAITWKYLEPYIPVNTDAFVLDAGGGTGRWSVRIARKGCKVVLMDASSGMLRIAAERISEEGLQRRITMKKGDITKTGYSDETFDVIFSEQTLFLFKEPDTLIKELSRVLKKNGRLVISAHNRYAQCLASLPEKPTSENLDKARKLLLGERHSSMAKDGTMKIYSWSPQEFREILERNGLQVEKIIGKGTTMPLRISKHVFAKKKYPEKLFSKILLFELAICEKPDAVALAGILQAITRKL